MGSEKGKDLRTGLEEPCLTTPKLGLFSSSLRMAATEKSPSVHYPLLAPAHPSRLCLGQAAPTTGAHTILWTGFIYLVHLFGHSHLSFSQLLWDLLLHFKTQLSISMHYPFIHSMNIEIYLIIKHYNGSSYFFEHLMVYQTLC